VATKDLKTSTKEMIINIVSDGRIIASDTTLISIGEFGVKHDVKIALLAGTNGILEDVLYMTGANYRIISNRFLETRDLDYYDIILIGSGAHKNYNSLYKADGKLKRFMEYGGTVLVLGQSDEWPSNLLPVSIKSAQRKLERVELEIADDSHGLFNVTYKIKPTRLLKAVEEHYTSYPASVFPGEKIIAFNKTATVLAETKMEKGRLIYCGLPLMEMLKNLDKESMKFFSNLMNYSGQ
jgi:hypothetical protein